MSSTVKVKRSSKGKGNVKAGTGAGTEGLEATAKVCRWLRNYAQALKKINFN